MLPCQSRCPDFHPGCHKVCLRWRQYLLRQQKEREAKTAYLRFHLERCDTVTRQLRAAAGGRPPR